MFKRSMGIRVLEGILGVLAIVAGIASIANPIAALSAAVIVIGIFALAQGIVSIIGYGAVKKATGISVGAGIVAGVLEIILGLLLLFGIQNGVALLTVIFPIWFIISCASTLSHLDHIKTESTGMYWFTLIINVIGIFVGISLIFTPVASASIMTFLIAFYLIMIGVQYIAIAFTNISYESK